MNNNKNNNNNDNQFRIENLKRECLYFFLIMVLVGFLVGYLMNRHRLEEDTANYLIISPIFFTCLGGLITFIKYRKGLKKIDEKVMYDENIIEKIEEKDNE